MATKQLQKQEAFPTEGKILALAASPQNVKQGSKYQGGKPYIPISYIERDLDEIFTPFGWQTCDFQLVMVGTKQSGSNIHLIFTASITLKVWDEGKGCWIERQGSSSGETSEKQTGTFAPKLKAEAIKNAAKSFGNRLGRNIARKQGDAATSDAMTFGLTIELKDYLAKLDAAETIEAATSIWHNHPQRENEDYKNAYKKTWKRLKDTTSQNTIGE